MRRRRTCWRREHQRLEQHCLAHPHAAQETFDFPFDSLPQPRIVFTARGTTQLRLRALRPSWHSSKTLKHARKHHSPEALEHNAPMSPWASCLYGT